MIITHALISLALELPNPAIVRSLIPFNGDVSGRILDWVILLYNFCERAPQTPLLLLVQSVW